MSERIHLDHNTYLATGSAEASVRAIYAALEETLNVATKGNPDFWHGTFSSFGVDEARELKSMSAMKPFGDRRVMILETLVMTEEAQQAILKLAEELSQSSYLFLVVPTERQILPTLRSRLIRLSHESGGGEASSEATEFLSSGWKDREALIAEIHKEKDARRAYLLLDDLERLLARGGKREGLADILLAKQRLLEGIVPMKMTLETAAILLPRASV